MSWERLKSVLASVDEIEVQTGLDFLSDLPDENLAIDVRGREIACKIVSFPFFTSSLLRTSFAKGSSYRNN